jgi:Glycosyl transferase family 2/Methyltransferase domain
MHGSVTAAIPYREARPYLAQAVESLLAQTHLELTVIVVNDDDPVSPWPLLDHLDDRRLVRFDLDRNRGRYFADQVVLEATADTFYLVQDADDWSEPARVERLLAELRRHHACGALSARHLVTGRGDGGRTEMSPRLGAPLTPVMEHRGTQQGLFRTDALHSVGGFHPGFRIGYDTLLINLLEMIGRVVAVDLPLYHARIRPGSLTTAPATRWGSASRADAVRRLETLYGRAYRNYQQYLWGNCDETWLACSIRELVAGSTEPTDAAAVHEQAARLRRLLPVAQDRSIAPPARRRRAAVTTQPARGPTPLKVYELVEDGGLPFDGWQIGPTLAVELAEHLELMRPRTLLQLGCGSSTAVLAAHIARRGGTLTVIDHDTARIDHTRERLNRLGLGDSPQLKAARLNDFRCPDGITRPWYDVVLTDCFDFIFVDGPPLRIGRGAALFALDPHLAADGELWLHDAYRPHERQCLDLWRAYLPVHSDVQHLDDRGVAMLRRGARPAGGPPPDEIPDGIAVSLLTGGRPDLLLRTVESLARTLPQLLERARVTAFVNGDDAESSRFVASLPFVDRIIRHRGRRLPIGPAASRVIAQALKPRDARYLLHLEDDWEVSTQDDTWLWRAVTILDGEPQIGQVRLRHRGDRVRRWHMVTARAIRWEERAGYLLSESAHWTFNPSLIRANDAPAAWPADDEATAQRAFLRSGLWTAQLTPGVFRHLG